MDDIKTLLRAIEIHTKTLRNFKQEEVGQVANVLLLVNSAIVLSVLSQDKKEEIETTLKLLLKHLYPDLNIFIHISNEEV